MRFLRQSVSAGAVLGGMLLLASTAATASASVGTGTPTPNPCQPSTSTAVSPSNAAYPAGSTVTYTITVYEYDPNCTIFGSPATGGSVTVTDNGADAAALPSPTSTWSMNYPAHTATLVWSAAYAHPGAHTVTFAYTNSAGVPAGSAANAQINIYGPPQLATPVSSLNPATAGNPVTITGNLAWSGGPPTTTEMSFWDGTALLGKSAIVAVAGGYGRATFTVPNFTVGTHVITISVPSTPAGNAILRSAALSQKVTPAPSSAPTPTPKPSSAPTPTAAPTATPTSEPTATATPIPAHTATAGGPPGAAPSSLVTGLHLSGSDLPLMGSHPPTSLEAGMFDRATVPPIDALDAISVNFGSSLTIWPFLLVVTLGSCIGVLRARHLWLAEERHEAELDANPDGLRSAPTFRPTARSI